MFGRTRKVRNYVRIRYVQLTKRGNYGGFSKIGKPESGCVK
jgi:hypothetical protein